MSAKSAHIASLHPAAQQVIKHYTHLNIGGKEVVAPYFMNTPGRKGRRVRVGKGTPKELEQATLRLAKRHGFDVHAATPSQIRDFMIQYQLGIDCSGLVAWVAHTLARHTKGRLLWHDMQFGGHPLRALARQRLRPVENLGARTITHPKNAHTISDLRQVRPGDIIRSLNGNHVLLITEIGYKRQQPTYFKYVNSTEYGGIKYGVRFGRITITDSQAPILQQEWIDGENGINWIFNAANNYPNDTRVVRLKSLA